MMKSYVPIIAISALIASSVSAWSGSPSTGSLQIKMTIDKACTVNPGGDAVLDFGEHGLVTGDIDKESSIKVQCTKGIVYSIALKTFNLGGWRYMRPISGGKEPAIQYRLYKDSARTNIWAEDTSGITTATPLTGQTADGTLQSIPVYGHIENKDIASVPPGTYTDMVTVTVQF